MTSNVYCSSFWDIMSPNMTVDLSIRQDGASFELSFIQYRASYLEACMHIGISSLDT